MYSIADSELPNSPTRSLQTQTAELTVVSDQEKNSEMNFEFIGLNHSNRSLVIGYEPKMQKNGLQGVYILLIIEKSEEI